MKHSVQLSISLAYQTSSRLGVGDCSGYIRTIDTRIVGIDAFGSEVLLGELQLYAIQLSNATDDGIELFDVFDSLQEILDVGTTLYDRTFREFRPEVERRFPGADSCDDVLLLHRLTIDPPFRGQRLGLAVLQQAMRDWWSGCSLVVIKPFPLQFESEAKRSGSWSRAQLEGFSQHEPTAVKRLRTYYGKLGFVRIRRSKFFALSPSQLQPANREDFPDLLTIDASVLDDYLESTSKQAGRGRD